MSLMKKKKAAASCYALAKQMAVNFGKHLARHTRINEEIMGNETEQMVEREFDDWQKSQQSPESNATKQSDEVTK